MRSQLVTCDWSRGLEGLPNQGSNRIVLPPGVLTSQHEWPNQVNVVSRSIPTPDLLAFRLIILGPDGVRGALGYTPAVPAERIAENLAYINWTVLTSLAIGSFGAVVLARLRTDA